MLDAPDTTGGASARANAMVTEASAMYRDSAWLYEPGVQETFWWVEGEGLLARFQHPDHEDFFLAPSCPRCERFAQEAR